MLALLAAAATFQNQVVSFGFDNTRLKNISVSGACILGDDVHTNGGYLIGSADGSDAQGHSVISVGGGRGHMHSDDPQKITPPDFQMHFEPVGQNRLRFSVSVGPVAQDFETISFPFDFGLKMMDRFAFNNTSYKLICSENDGTYQGHGNEYSFIRPKCEIRDIKGTLIGKVGGAETGPASWAEVDGPYATVRVAVAQSQHYKKLVFFNHPGTHNLEFSFGKLKNGEMASLSGEITVTPKAGPDSWIFDGAKEFNHQIGRAEADGWSVHVGDEVERYMYFGPYATEIGVGPRVARFSLMLDNTTADNAKILTIDVCNATTGAVLNSADLTRGQFRIPLQYQEFVLPFYAPPSARLEFRTQWHGVSYAREKQVVVSK